VTDQPRLLVATRSHHKLAELRDLLHLRRAELVDLDDEGIHDEVEETGRTFSANAALKARFYARRSGLPTLADDSGLEVDALGGGPGVRTRRYAGEQATDGQNNAKLLAALTDAGLSLPARYPRDWVVDCKSVGTGEAALVYLGRYLYRGVIREKDIVACAEGQVTFCYRDAKTGKMMRRTMPGCAFLWLVLQHVLPKGFRRARNFGFLHPNCKRLIALVQVLLKVVPGSAATWIKPRAPMRCPCCGAVMVIVKTRIRPPDAPLRTGPWLVPIASEAAGAALFM